MPKITIDEKLFAHINTDPFLRGSFGLEGNQFANTIGYLDQYIKRLNEKNGVSLEVNQLLKACSLLSAYEESIRLNRAPGPDLGPLSKQVQQKASELKDNEFLLLPGGWLTPKGGHAIIYQIQKDTDGDFLFSIHNSGSGLEYHEKRSDKEKELYNPVLTYKIPKEKINHPNFTQFLSNLFAAQIPQLNQDNEASHLYETVFSQLSYVDGTIVKNKDEHCFTAGQLSGTCTQHSLHVMLKSRFKDLDEYRKFIYGFKAFSLDDYYQSLKASGEIKNPKFHGQLEKAIKHQLRLLNLKSTIDTNQDLFGAQEKEADSNKLQTYLSELRSLRQEIKANTEKTDKAAPTLSFEHPIYLRQRDKLEINATAHYGPEYISPIIKVNAEHLLDDMEKLILSCKTGLSQNNHRYLYEQLDDFFTQLPLPIPPETFNSSLKPFYASLQTEEQLLLFFQKLGQLQKYYIHSCNTLLGTQSVIANMYLVKLSICAVTAHINANRPLSASGPYHGPICNLVRGITTGYSKATYLATNNPDLDKRLKDIQGLYLQPDAFSNQAEIPYYQNIINTFPKLKTELEEKYFEKYNNDSSKLHTLVKQQKCSSLYYLINHFNELNSLAQYKPLLTKFQQQQAMELLYIEGAERLKEQYSYGYSNQITIDEHASNKINMEIDLSFNKEDLLLLTNTGVTLNTMSPGPSLLQRKYPLKNSPVTQALSIKYTHPIPDNLIQTVPAKFLLHQINEKESAEIAQLSIEAIDLQNRELFYLRAQPSSQIPLSLDYFNLHPDKLSKKDLQIYLEANLFEPGLLREILLDEKKSSEFYEQFNQFIKNGLKYTEKKGLLTQQSLFYIRMAYLVNRYAKDLDPIKYTSKQEDFIDQLNGFISTQTEPTIKSTLNQYRFLSRATTQETSAQQISQALTSLFYSTVIQNPHHTLDFDSQFKYINDHRQFKKLLQSQKELISSELIKNILQDLNLPLDTNHAILIEEKYPNYMVKSNGALIYTLNVEQGLIYKDNLAYQTPPLNMLNHPIYKKFVSKDTVSSVAPDHKTYFLGQPPTWRFIKSYDSYRIQKKWVNSLNEEKWYELITTSTEQAHDWQIPLEINEDNFAKMGKIISEREALTWRSVDDNSLIISDANAKVAYEGNARYTGIVLTNPSNQGKLSANNSWMHEQLGCFEDASFINVWASESAYTIDLKRYGITLNAKPESTDIHWSWENSDYQLVKGGALGDGISHLRFKSDKQELCVVAIQPFINSGQRSAESEYYHLQHDNSSKVHQKLTSDNRKVAASWQYSDSEHYIVYKMENGRPLPSSTEEALYLCYLYLGSNQPEKAWDVLEDCAKRLGGFSGRYEELQYLSWIINALPYPLTPEDNKAVISNPAHVSCKLKALSLYTQFTRLGKTIDFPPEAPAPTTLNAQFEQNSMSAVKAFQQNINNDIYTLYSRLQPMRRELSAGLTLTDVEARSLLDHYHKNSSAALGALGYEWVQLNLNILHQEWMQLIAKSQTRALSDYEQGRKKEIAELIEKHQGVAKITSTLEYRPIDLSIPEDSSINTIGLPPQLKLDLSDFNRSVTEKRPDEMRQQQAIKALVLGIKDADFLSYIADYLHIATTENHPLQKPLLDFCKAALIANRHVSLARQTTNIPLLANVLYRLINNPKPGTLNHYSFNYLINYARELANVPSIEIPQLKDDSSELLISSQELWAAMEKIPPTLPPSIPKDIHIPLTEWLDERFLKLKDEWHLIEERFLTGQGKKTTPSLHDELPLSALDKKEIEAGTVRYQALAALQTLAEKSLASNDIRQLLMSQCQIKIQTLSQTQASLEQEILSLGNQGPDDPLLKQAWTIDITSGKRKELALNDLLQLYFHADTNRYAKHTGLDANKLSRLHGLLTTYIANGTQHKQIIRTLEQLKRVEEAPKEEQAQALFALGKTLFAKNQIDVVKDPALSFFQYHSNLLLHTQQIKALARLLTTTAEEQFDETIEKIIMGGGKSKVITPSLAQKKALGNNLVIIEVPKPLLRTSYIDLKATSSELFNQDAHLFEFNRDSDCTAARLEEIYTHFTEIMVNKQYLVTTGDALQSLELKYLELLLQEEHTDLEEWRQQVLWAERLVLLLRNRGDLIIDEVHQGLQLKSKLNYNLGEPSGLPKQHLQLSLDLYQFFSKVPFDQVNLHDALINRKITDKEKSEAAVNALLNELLSSESSPLSDEINEFSKHSDLQNVRTILKQYLLNEAKSIPDFVAQSTPEIKEKIGFYKGQFAKKTGLLAFTLSQQQGEHYGPSLLSSRTPAERMIAKPYSSNNVPKERSEWGNFLEAINYTTQSLMISGIAKDLMHMVIDAWLVEARAEVSAGNAPVLDETLAAARFRAIVGKEYNISFSELDPENEEQLTLLHQQSSKNTALIFDVLKTHILPKIKTNEAILHSDNYAHVDLVRSCQGITGTPWNYTTFHERLRFAEESALGTDSYVLRAIAEKAPRIHGVNFTETTGFIHALFSSYQADDKLRSIIDVSASFKGISNLTVAQGIAAYVQQHPEQFSTPEPLKYILFFNAKDELCALRVQKNIEDQLPILIGSSDPKVIDSRLNCGPAARFTYYDQSHTIGADIKQSPKSKALVLIDQNTHFQNFLQGSMRMRDLLEGEQSIDLVVPPTLANESFDALSTRMVTNQKRQLQQDNYNATCAKMTNVIRNNLMQHLVKIPSDDLLLKQKFLKTVNHYFIELQSINLFELYKDINQEQDTVELLKTLQNHLLNDWKRLLQASSFTVSSAGELKLQEKIKNIVALAAAPGFCAPKQMARAAKQAFEVEAQQEKENQQENQTQNEEQREVYKPKRHSMWYQSWKETYQPNDVLQKSLAFKTLTELCASTGAKNIPSFDANITASINFYKTYTDQSKYIGMSIKPVHAILFKKEINGQLKCIILTQQEYAELHTQVDKVTDGSVWISTTQHTVLAGAPPLGFKEDKNYQSIIEQVRYFNGEFKLLLNRDAPFSWLYENSQEKLDFFTQHLATCHETEPGDITSIKNRLSLSTKIFKSIATAPWKDYSTTDWKRRYPALEKEDLQNIEKLAEAFKELTALWQNNANFENDSIPKIIENHQLPLNALAYFNRYAEQLRALKALCAIVKQESINAIQEKRPLKLRSLLNHDIRNKLSFLNLEIEALLSTNDTEEALLDHQLLTILMHSIPMLKNDAEMQAIKMDNQIAMEDYYLPTLDRASVPDALLLHIAQHTSRTPTLLKLFERHDFKQNKDQIYLALANNPATSEKILLEIAKQTTDLRTVEAVLLHKEMQETKAQLYDLLIKNPNKSFLLLIVGEITDTNQVRDILNRPDMQNLDKTTEKVFKELASNLHWQNEALLRKILEKTQSASTVKSIIQNRPKQLTYDIISDMVKNPILDSDDLIFIAKHADFLSIKAIIDWEGMKPPSENNDLVLMSLLENEQIQDPVFLDIMINRAYLAETVHSILLKKTQYLSHEVLIHSLEKDNIKDEALILIASHANSSKTILKKSALKAQDSSTIQFILDKDLTLDHKDKNAEIFNVLSDESLDKLINQATTTATTLNNMLNAKPQISKKILAKLLSMDVLEKDKEDLKEQLIDQMFSPSFAALNNSRHFGGDRILDDYINAKKQECKTARTLEQLKTLMRELKKTIAIMNSPEVLAVREYIKQLSLKDSSLFKVHGLKKAIKIEKAMVAVPLQERHQISSIHSPEIVEVQRALTGSRTKLTRYLKKHGFIKDKSQDAPLKKDNAASASEKILGDLNTDESESNDMQNH